MCYSVYVGSTLKTIRIPDDVLARLEAEALEVERSLNWVIVRKLGGVAQQDRSRTGTHQKKAGETPAAAGSSPATAKKCPIQGHNGFQRSDGYWCQTCGRMYR